MSFRRLVPPTLHDAAVLSGLGVRRLLPQAFLTGLVSGAVIGVFRMAYDKLCALSLAALALGVPGPAKAACVAGALALLAFLAWLALRLEPLVSGSGIPQVELMTRGKCSLRWWRVLPCKFFGTLASLAGGLAVGREGPCVMMGAMVGAGVGGFWHANGPHNLPRFLVGGGVAGMTAAFSAPLAGLCFAVEEMRTALAAPMLIFTGTCALTAWAVVDLLLGLGLVFPFGAAPLPPWPLWWLAPVLGCLMGGAGALHNRLLLGLTCWEDRRRWPQWARVGAPFALAFGLLHLYPDVLGGVGLGVLRLESLPLPLGGLLLLLLARLAWSCVSFASGVSGGILMPLLLLGALGGACLASGLEMGGVATAGQSGAWLTLGMAGMFAGAVRAPLTASALLLEMTGAFHLAPLVLLCAFAANATANFLRVPPVYDSLRGRCLAQARRAVPAAGEAPPP